MIAKAQKAWKVLGNLCGAVTFDHLFSQFFTLDIGSNILKFVVNGTAPPITFPEYNNN